MSNEQSKAGIGNDKAPSEIPEDVLGDIYDVLARLRRCGIVAVMSADPAPADPHASFWTSCNMTAEVGNRMLVRIADSIHNEYSRNQVHEMAEESLLRLAKQLGVPLD